MNIKYVYENTKIQKRQKEIYKNTNKWIHTKSCVEFEHQTYQWNKESQIIQIKKSIKKTNKEIHKKNEKIIKKKTKDK